MSAIETTTVIPQRELRNNISDILRRVKDGESFTVTTNDEPVARLIPDTLKYPPVSRPATKKTKWSEFPRVTVDETIEQILADLQDDR